MKLEAEEGEYSFSSADYEESGLQDPQLTVTEVTGTDEMLDTARGTGSCLLREDESDLQEYLQKFSSMDRVHFYDIEGRGYARSIELSTSEGDALCVDAVRTRGSFLTGVYRAGVNGVFHHAQVMDKDIVLGGDEFFRDTWGEELDLTYDRKSFTPAEDVFFDQRLAEGKIDVENEQKQYIKGEQWDEAEAYFLTWI